MRSNEPYWLQKLEYELSRTNENASHTLSESQLVSSVEVGSIMRVSARTVQRWARAGHIPHLRIGKTIRFRLRDVFEHVQHQ